MMLLQGPVPPPPPPPVPPVIPDFPDPPFWVTQPAPVVVFTIVVITVGIVLLLLPLVRALGRRLEGRTAPDPELRAELDDLRARVHHLEAQHGQLAELEERLDFAERLLAQQRSTLPPGPA